MCREHLIAALHARLLLLLLLLLLSLLLWMVVVEVVLPLIQACSSCEQALVAAMAL